MATQTKTISKNIIYLTQNVSLNLNVIQENNALKSLKSS